MPKVSSDRFREAVEVTRGNLTRAASVLGISKVHAMRLAARYGLRERARDLRREAGWKTGRPPVERTSS